MKHWDIRTQSNLFHNLQAGSLSDFYEICRGLELARNFQFPNLREVATAQIMDLGVSHNTFVPIL